MLFIFFFQNKEDYLHSYGCDEIPEIPEIPGIPEIPEIFNGIPVKEDNSFVYGGYNQPSLDKNGQIYWPKSIVKHVGLENLPMDNFEVIIGPFGTKRIISQQEIEQKHKSVVEQGWLATKRISVKEESLIFTNSNDYLKVKPCANEIQKRNCKISSSILHLLGTVLNTVALRSLFLLLSNLSCSLFSHHSKTLKDGWAKYIPSFALKCC